MTDLLGLPVFRGIGVPLKCSVCGQRTKRVGKHEVHVDGTSLCEGAALRLAEERPA